MRIRRFAAPDGNGKHFGRKPYFCHEKKRQKEAHFSGCKNWFSAKILE
jgi:hypothetical protein